MFCEKRSRVPDQEPEVPELCTDDRTRQALVKALGQFRGSCRNVTMWLGSSVGKDSSIAATVSSLLSLSVFLSVSLGFLGLETEHERRVCIQHAKGFCIRIREFDRHWRISVGHWVVYV